MTRIATGAHPLDAGGEAKGAQSLAGVLGAFEARRLEVEGVYALPSAGVGRDTEGMAASRRGAVRIVLILGVIALSVLALWLASGLFGGRSEGAAEEGLTPSASPSAVTAAAAHDALPNRGDDPAMEVVRSFDRDDGGLVGAPLALPANWEPDFDGRGSIRGRVLVPIGTTPPPALHVTARPSRILRGRERARTAEVELEPGETEFELEDLPLGGYELEVEGAGLHAAPQSVLLVKGSADPYVTLAVHPTGFIDGHVRHADGRAAEGVEVGLEPLAGGARRTTHTRTAGDYLFEDVRDGEYRISFGPPEAPLLPARELSFRAPSMQFTPQVLPALVELRLIVLDPDGQRVEGAKIDGYGSRGGQVHASSDFRGEALVERLPPGKYRISARDALGRRGRLELELALDGPTEHTLHLRP